MAVEGNHCGLKTDASETSKLGGNKGHMGRS
jgi:hypothetical protein